jgi:hypothetical protein
VTLAKSVLEAAVAWAAAADRKHDWHCDAEIYALFDAVSAMRAESKPDEQAPPARVTAADSARESCATYTMVLDLCVGALPRPAMYGELPGWIAQLVAVADAARKLRSIERLRAESTLPPAPEWDLGALWTAQTALDAALAKVGER